MRTVLQMANIQTIMLPEKWQHQDVRYPDELVRHFVEAYSSKGDLVVDPFAGFGTTVRVAESMGRVAYGVEFDAERCEWARTHLQYPERMINGDSRDYAALKIPKSDLCLTSPPYMGRTHSENPFTAYSTVGGGYGQYLHDIKTIFAQVKLRMNPGAHIIVEVSNLKHEDETITTLAWDIARVLGEILIFEGETVIEWKPTYAYGYDHSYALVFRRA